MENPLGARALYLLRAGRGLDLPRPWDQRAGHDRAGRLVGLEFRMLNADVIDLYRRVDEGARVVVG